MATPATRDQFITYCMRRLGSRDHGGGAHRVNITPEQMEDRLDDAISFWRDYHYAATEKSFFKHQLTDNDVSNKYITVPDDILEVTRIVDFSNLFSGASFTNYKYQLMLGSMWTFLDRPLSPYVIAMMDLALINETLGNKVVARFNRHSNKLYIDTNWNLLSAGSYLVLEAYYFLNPEVVTEMWSDRWLQRYCTALYKRQWGENLSKYVGQRILDGYEFNGDRILQEAKEEIQLLETEVVEKYSLPPLGVIA